MDSNNIYGFSDYISSIFRIFSIEGVDGEVVITFLVILVMSVLCFIKFIKSVQQTLEIPSVIGDTLIVQPPQPSFNRSEEPCPVCYGTIRLSVETGCFHLYCGTCILGLIQYARHRNITCPVCRTGVLMLYPVFTVEEYNVDINSELGQTRNNLISEIQEYNHLFSGGNRSFSQTIRELPILVRRIWRSLSNPNDVYVQNRMKTLFYIILFGVALYILFPFDLLPEVYFGIFGYLDDILVLGMSLFYLTSFYRNLFFTFDHHIN